MDAMLSKALRDFLDGPHHQLFVNLAGEKGGVWESEFKKFLRQEPCWTPDKILEVFEGITIPKTATEFIAKNSLVVNTDKKAKVWIGESNIYFQKFFLEKIEPPQPERCIFRYKLIKDSHGKQIVKAFGGAQKAATTLSDIWFMMARQGHGGAGILLNNSQINLFFVFDSKGILRPVRVSWYKGWLMYTSQSNNVDNNWDKGYRLFSPQFIPS